MSRLTIDINQVVVETEAERAKLALAEPAVQEAFRLLGERLARTPFDRFGGGRQHALDRLRTSALSLDELLSSRGAERLADELYRQLVEQMA